MKFISSAFIRWLRDIGFFVAVATLGLSACSDSDNQVQKANSEKPVVALIMKSLANEFFVNMQQAAQAHHSEHAQDYELIVNGIKNESDLAQQVALVDQMIARGVDAIVIAPADSKALVPALARAHTAGIAIVNIDNQLDKAVAGEFGLSIPFIGPSNRDGARLVAQ